MGLGLAGFVGSGVVYYYELEKKRLQEQSTKTKITSVGKPLLGGKPWTLVDCTSRAAFSSKDLFTMEQKYHLLYFGFTHCPDICPNELKRIGQVVDELKAKHSITILPTFITVDPARDTVKQMNYYKQDLHPSFRMLTGTDEQIEHVAKSYRVYFSKADEDTDGGYLIDHSIVMYLVNDEGEFIDFFTQSAKVSDIVQRTMAKIKE